MPARSTLSGTAASTMRSDCVSKPQVLQTMMATITMLITGSIQFQPL